MKQTFQGSWMRANQPDVELALEIEYLRSMLEQYDYLIDFYNVGQDSRIHLDMTHGYTLTLRPAVVGYHGYRHWFQTMRFTRRTNTLEPSRIVMEVELIKRVGPGEQMTMLKFPASGFEWPMVANEIDRVLKDQLGLTIAPRRMTDRDD